MNRTYAQIGHEYSEHGRNLLLFGLNAHDHNSRTAYLSEAAWYQDASARYYRADRLARGLTAPRGIEEGV